MSPGDRQRARERFMIYFAFGYLFLAPLATWVGGVPIWTLIPWGVLLIVYPMCVAAYHGGDPHTPRSRFRFCERHRFTYFYLDECRYCAINVASPCGRRDSPDRRLRR
jgi:hypothetical protein